MRDDAWWGDQTAGLHTGLEHGHIMSAGEPLPSHPRVVTSVGWPSPFAPPIAHRGSRASAGSPAFRRGGGDDDTVGGAVRRAVSAAAPHVSRAAAAEPRPSLHPRRGGGRLGTVDEGAASGGSGEDAATCAACGGRLSRARPPAAVLPHAPQTKELPDARPVVRVDAGDADGADAHPRTPLARPTSAVDAVDGPTRGVAQPAVVAQPTMTTCWRRASAALSSHLASAGYTTVVLLGYGLSLFVNSISGSLLGPQTPAQSLFLLSSGRAGTLLLVLPVLLALGHRPAWASSTSASASHSAGVGTGGGGGATRGDAIAVCIPAIVAVAGNSAYLAYYALVAGGEVGVLAPMVGLYSVIPVTVGLTCRGEERTWQKLAGIALAFAAVLILGLSGGGSFAPSGGAVGLKVLYFLVCWATWGTNDTLSSAVHLDAFTVALSSLFGQLLCCAAYGFASFVQFNQAAVAAQAAGGGGSGGAALVPFGWPHAAVLGANALAIVGWLAFVRLGQLGPASSFVPICALYTYVPVLLSVAVLGEAMDGAKIAGLCVAAVAVLLISTSWGGAGAAASHGGATTALAGRPCCGPACRRLGAPGGASTSS